MREEPTSSNAGPEVASAHEDETLDVLLLTQYYPPEVGAAQTRLAAVVAALAARGDRVEVVTALPNYPLGRIFDGYRRTLMRTERERTASVRRVWMFAAMGTGTRRLVSYMSFTITSLFGLLRTRRPDVLLVESPPLFTAVPAIVYGRLRRVPVVLNIADLWPDAAVAVGALGQGRVLRSMLALEGWAYRHAFLLTTVTDGVRAKLVDQKGVPADKVLMLGNGVDIEVFDPANGDPSIRAELGLPAGDFLIYAGTMGLAHGIDPLIDAFSQLADADPYLLMIGSGSERPRLEALAVAQGLDNIVFRDPVPPDQLARLFPLALAGVVTLADIAINELARPAKLFPVMASGVPVLFAGGGEGARIVTDTDSGVVVANVADQIKGAVEQLAADPAASRRQGDNGRRYVVEHWSWKQTVHAWRTQLGERMGARR